MLGLIKYKTLFSWYVNGSQLMKRFYILRGFIFNLLE
jgi:hypothetical protein